MTEPKKVEPKNPYGVHLPGVSKDRCHFCGTRLDAASRGRKCGA